MAPAGGFARGQGIGSGEPQCQLTVRTDVAVDERRKRRGQGTPGEIEAAHNLPRDVLPCILGPMFGGVERHDDANRVAVFAVHQIADGGFEIGLLDIGLGERGAEVSEIIDDKIKWFDRDWSVRSTESSSDA
jgi:hypothetical protein